MGHPLLAAHSTLLAMARLRPKEQHVKLATAKWMSQTWTDTPGYVFLFLSNSQICSNWGHQLRSPSSFMQFQHVFPSPESPGLSRPKCAMESPHCLRTSQNASDLPGSRAWLAVEDHSDIEGLHQVYDQRVLQFWSILKARWMRFLWQKMVAQCSDQKFRELGQKDWDQFLRVVAYPSVF